LIGRHALRYWILWGGREMSWGREKCKRLSLGHHTAMVSDVKRDNFVNVEALMYSFIKKENHTLINIKKEHISK
jgi:hypothetical protein